MGKIKILKDVVANRIAAGEVVERPESIVKELMENSIDAGADKVDIYIKNGGKSIITVIDNGCGMSYDDAIIAFERHATSKIISEKDLESISTLGFRGEALPSIGSVSKLTLKTKIKEEKEGTIVKIEGGTIKNVIAAPMNNGTEIEISSLFYNIPARKKFLKSVETEYGRIVRVVNSYALANPHIAFTLSHNGKTVISFSKRQNLESRVSSLISNNYLFNEIIRNDIQIKAFLLPPEFAFKSSSKQFFLLNGRFVKERTLSSAVLSAYKSTTSFFSGYPQVVLWLNIPSHFVDVNVHPSKLEVRFRNQGVIYDMVKEVCMEALNSRKKTPEIYFNNSKEKLTLDSQFNSNIDSNYLNNRNTFKNNSYQKIQDTGNFPDIIGEIPPTYDKENTLQQQESINFKYTDYKVIGQYHNSYILAEKDKELFIIDQHVAHERILYEKTLKQLKGNKIEISKLLIPEIVNVGQEILPLILPKQEFFNKSGFYFQKIDEKSIKIIAIPVFVKQTEITKTFMEIVSIVVENKDKDIEEIYKDLAATVGCKAAIKANTNLSYPEMQNLLVDFVKCDNPFYCPHGRPIVIKLTLDEIEKLFKRK